MSRTADNFDSNARPSPVVGDHVCRTLPLFPAGRAGARPLVERLVAPRAGALRAHLLVGDHRDRRVEHASIPDSNSSGTSTTAARGGGRLLELLAPVDDPRARRAATAAARASARSSGVANASRASADRSTTPSRATDGRRTAPYHRLHLVVLIQVVDHRSVDSVAAPRRSSAVERGRLAGADAAREPDEAGSLGGARSGSRRAPRPLRRRARLGSPAAGCLRSARRASSASTASSATPPRSALDDGLGRRASGSTPAAASRASGSARLGLRLVDPTAAWRPRTRPRTARARARCRGRRVAARSGGTIGRTGSTCPSTRLIDSDRRRRSESISRILTRTGSPGWMISRGFSTWCWASSEMWTRPSTPSRISTNAPNVTTFVTLPSSSSPML